MNEILNKLHEAAASPRAQMDGYLAQGKKIVLCAPVYTSYDRESGALGGETQVTTGVSDGTNVEITGGLSQGDTVYYRYAEAGDSANMFGGGIMPGGLAGENEGFNRGSRGGAEGGMPGGQP